MPDETKRVINDAIESSIRVARSSERLRSIAVILGLAAEEYRELFNLDPELGPELRAAGEALETAVEATRSAHAVVMARASVESGRLGEEEP